MLDTLIIIVMYAICFSLGFVFWFKILDKADKIVQEKLDEDTYNVVICVLFVLCVIKIIFK